MSHHSDVSHPDLQPDSETIPLTGRPTGTPSLQQDPHSLELSRLSPMTSQHFWGLVSLHSILSLVSTIVIFLLYVLYTTLLGSIGSWIWICFLGWAVVSVCQYLVTIKFFRGEKLEPFQIKSLKVVFGVQIALELLILFGHLIPSAIASFLSAKSFLDWFYGCVMIYPFYMIYGVSLPVLMSVLLSIVYFINIRRLKRLE